MTETEPPRVPRRWLITCILLLGLAGGLGVLLWRSSAAQQAESAPKAAPAAVPVTIAKAARQDVPVYLRGLGTVQAFNAVTVRSRVDGTLMRIAVTEGQHVKQNDLIAVIDPRPYQAALDAALAKKAQDEAQLTNARRDLARYASLAKQDFASRQQVDNQQSTGRSDDGGDPGEPGSGRNRATQSELLLHPLADHGPRRAPAIGPWNLVHANDSTGIVTISQIQPISVVFTLPQATLPRIQQAQRLRSLEVAALAADDKRVLDTGKLLASDSAIDTSTGTIRLKATFPNPDETLWPGQFVEARLLLDTRKDTLTVPTAAIQHGPAGLYVYVLKPDHTVAHADVKIEPSEGNGPR